MSRRSSRLVSGGYYNSDEESDSSSVTNISYREIPVKVFKKKAGTRKVVSRTPSKARSNVRSSSTEPLNTAEQYDGLSPSPLATPTQTNMRTVPYISPDPRPALTPSSARSSTPTFCPSVPPESSSYTAGLCSSSRPGLHLRPNLKELNQSSVDSSGYSSSEGTHRWPTAPASSSSSSRVQSTTQPISDRLKNSISSAFISLTDSASLIAAAVHSKMLHLTALAQRSVSATTMKACGLVLLLLLLLLLCFWFLIPLLTSLTSRMSSTTIPSQVKPQSQPVIPAPPPLSQPNTVVPTPAVDPAVVSAAVEAKMQDLMAQLQLTQKELQLKQEQHVSQLKDRLQVDMQDMKVKLNTVDQNIQLRLEQVVAALDKKMLDSETDTNNAAASLSLRIQALEAQNAKLSQELSTIQLLPPPAPSPETSSPPINNELTPELRQAMEAWFTDRIKEQDALRLRDKGCSADSGRPMADKMPDFALETQGASVISTRCSETYRIRSACVTLFGIPLWYPSESPRTVIQGFPVLLPGKCWAFHGVQGTLVISLSHPIRITHVTLDHLPRYNSPTGNINSAPKDFEVYGMKNDTEEGTLLGTFTYDEHGESTQTFKLPSPSDEVHRYVELRVLSNWGHVEYTCLYRFRVHGQIAST